ncbi:winged helix-turn-helix domain-containing protein [Pseudoalteromonas sp. SMS1]|uniref:winged helix-turn-helix domain-containing protein n=1 Tax=Pseudoalteromonas sp. SMS1 TaxID=2908894 RepID=UPI001F16DCAA|nr:winged helix-turn-helix domain-containing protein [Pseudoalteromonas sp. SMS1]MCF2859639.1 winged helix-turn-helix domain-containing protein [Pseudoalteromonas sp. SMS1]
MTQQYWVGDFFVDISRNQITYQEHTQILAPKAIAVLTTLAQHQGHVVSQDTLLDTVWANTVVSPNTLQRSIAQLRKALGDDGKVQVIIKTHAKQGYSLESTVKWQHKDNTQTSQPTAEALNQSSPSTPGVSQVNHPTVLKRAALILGSAALLSLALFSIPERAPTKLEIAKLNALTATDHRENAGVYSPDGKYVVFHRYEERLCINNIWAKSTTTQEEFQLTQQLNSHGSHTFSEDGSTLYFIQEQDCRQPITQKQCYKLMGLDFAKSLHSAQLPSTLMECKNTRINTPIWMQGNQIALLQQSEQRWKLISYAIDEQQSRDIFSPAQGSVIDYDYSLTDDLIALTHVDGDGTYNLTMLKPDGTVISQNRIKRPPEIAKHRFIYPNFSPFKEKLMFSTGRQLFTLSYAGDISTIDLPIDVPMGAPRFHPDGSRLLVIKGFYDRDMASFSLSEMAAHYENPLRDKHRQLHTIESRSITSEGGATFQPNGHLLAFYTFRSGIQQVWIKENSKVRQLSNFPLDSYLYGMHWARDGQSLLVNVSKELQRLSLTGDIQTFAFNYPIEQLFYWDSLNHTALANIRINGITKFAELNLAQLSHKVLTNSPVNWAQKDSKGGLIYTDGLDRFWRSGSLEDTLIDALNEQGSNLRFIIDNDIIYGVNEQFQLWRYELETQQFKLIGDMPRNLDYLSDVHNDTAFISLRIEAKKELAELVLKQ